MNQRERAIKYLSEGIPPTQVAKALGVTDALISQYMSESEFAEELQAATLVKTEADHNFDMTLQEAELKALENIKLRLPMANMQQSLAAFAILNKAQTRRNRGIVTNPGNQVGAIVQIMLPQQQATQYIKNSQAEIVEVGGQTLISASPSTLHRLLDQRGTSVVPAAHTESKVARADAQLETIVTPAKRKAVKLLQGANQSYDASDL
jgi:hypothetical protein